MTKCEPIQKLKSRIKLVKWCRIYINKTASYHRNKSIEKKTTHFILTVSFIDVVQKYNVETLHNRQSIFILSLLALYKFPLF